MASGILDGGHSPLVLTFRASSRWSLPWTAPRPRLPELLAVSGDDLRASTAWKELLQQWMVSDPVQALLSPSPGETAQSVSGSLQEALDALVAMAGGRSYRAPVRRRAYESSEVRRARASICLLGQCLALLLREVGVGSFSTPLRAYITRLRHRGLRPADSSRVALRTWVEGSIIEQREVLSAALRDMRSLRVQRWKDQVPGLWKQRPGALYRWLGGDSSSWGSSPILDTAGQQCTTLSEVDTAVQAYWVKGVWRMHEDVDVAASWEAFRASPFFAFIPRCEWPHETWTVERVRVALGTMREKSSPGVRGIPLSVWKSLPADILGRVSDLLTLVEREGHWPVELLSAYVAMIPKASGGSRPQDQRPITVLDVLYRLWAKGIIQGWAPVLQGIYLGPR